MDVERAEPSGRVRRGARRAIELLAIIGASILGLDDLADAMATAA